MLEHPIFVMILREGDIFKIYTCHFSLSHERYWLGMWKTDGSYKWLDGTDKGNWPVWANNHGHKKCAFWKRRNNGGYHLKSRNCTSKLYFLCQLEGELNPKAMTIKFHDPCYNFLG